LCKGKINCGLKTEKINHSEAKNGNKKSIHRQAEICSLDVITHNRITASSFSTTAIPNITSLHTVVPKTSPSQRNTGGPKNKHKPI